MMAFEYISPVQTSLLDKVVMVQAWNETNCWPTDLQFTIQHLSMYTKGGQSPWDVLSYNPDFISNPRPMTNSRWDAFKAQAKVVSKKMARGP